ncbi:MAG: FAD-binding oxidoreductase, partial [Alphaproteobacteria bacterium]|nr:FAD-binding oxidoreductase [Alphaproteobacteria bacterium]
MTASRIDSYYVASAIDRRARPQLEGSHNADVCVIGAGYTGLSCALHLARSGLKVVVLEAETAGFGASGRNGGQVITGQRVDQPDLERKYGEAHAHHLWNSALEARSLVLSLIDEHKIKCDVAPGHVVAAVRKSHARDLEAHVEHLARRYNYKDARYVSATEMP